MIIFPRKAGDRHLEVTILKTVVSLENTLVVSYDLSPKNSAKAI